MKTIQHAGWDANNPVQIFKADTTGRSRQIMGAILVGGCNH